MNTLSHIYIVEDDPISAFLSCRAIQSVVSPQIQIYTNGQDALEKLYSHSNNGTAFPELIFLDINMPTMGGYEFYRKYKDLTRDKKDSTVICILTSSSHSRDQMEFDDLGADEYVVKPLTTEKFTQIYNKYFLNILL